MRERGLRIAVAGAALLIFALGTAVAGRSEPVAPPAARPSVDVSHDRLLLVRGGVPTLLVVGAPIEIGATLTASVGLFEADPGARYARIVTLEVRDGADLVDGATISVAGHMLAMDHGSFATTAASRGDGRYVLRLPFVMPGEWQLDIHVTSAARSGDLTLELDEYE